MTEYTKKMVFGVFTVLFAGLLAALFGYFTRILLARNLSQESFGLIYAVLAVFGLLSILQHLGLNEALVKYISEFRVHNKKSQIKASIIIVVLMQAISAIALAAIFYFLADYLALNYFKSADAVWVIKLVALSVAISPLETIFLSSFQGFHRIDLYSLATFSRQVVLFALTWALLKYNYGILSYPIAFVAVYILTFVLYFPLFIKKVFPEFLRIKFKFEKDLAKKLIFFGIPVILTASATIVLSYTDTIMLTYFKTLKDVAYYNVAVPTAKVLWLFSTSITAVLLPLASELWAKEKKYLQEGAKMIYKYSTILILPAAFTMLIFAPVVIRLLFGADYEPAQSALRILSVGAIFVTLSQINMVIISGTGNPKYNSRVVWTAAIVNFCLNLFLIPMFGINGAAISTAIGFGLMMVLSQAKLRNLVDVHIDFMELLKIFLCSLAFIASLFALKNLLEMNIWLKIIISLLISGAIYLGLLFLAKIISIGETKMFMGRILSGKGKKFLKIAREEE